MRSPITGGPIVPAVLRLAWPVIVAEGLYTAYLIVDTAWVGGLGTEATAALTTSMFVSWILLALASLVATGLTAHVSQAIGAGDRARAGRAVAQGVHLAVLLGVVTAVAGWLAAPAVFRAIGAPPGVAARGAEYMRLLALASPATFLYMGAAAVMRASGDTRTPLKVSAFWVVVNAGLAPLLIYGPGPFPRLEVTGAALATLLAQVGAVVTFAWIARAGHDALPLARGGLGRVDWRLVGSLARVGAPYAMVITLFSVVYLYFASLAAATGAAALAIVGVANRLESINYLTADGFASAAATMVGQNLGAGQPERAARGAWTAAGLMSAVGVLLTLLFLAVPGGLLALFSRDPIVIADGSSYLRVLALCQIATGLEAVLSGGFAGAGDTLPPMIIHLAVSAARVPLAWWLSTRAGFGLDGIAWTVTLTAVARTAVLGGWFLRGRWKTRRLLATPAPPG